jgi:hypothetical protein
MIRLLESRLTLVHLLIWSRWLRIILNCFHSILLRLCLLGDEEGLLLDTSFQAAHELVCSILVGSPKLSNIDLLFLSELCVS